jgi:hypothetical protein
VPSFSYEIRITGILPPEALLDFEDLTASVEPVETVVQGPLPDQAALNGLLARLETLGVEVLEIRRLHDQVPPRPPGGPLQATPDPDNPAARGSASPTTGDA